MIHQQTIRPQKLFFASCVALLATSMTFAIRANLIEELGNNFKINPTDMGLVLGTAFWGFTLSMMFGGFLCDILGMKKLLIIAFIGHVLGIVLTIFASGFWSLFISTLFIGIANGMVEAACNPLVASLYPNAKTAKLNQLHVWFPGGIVIGGLLAFALQSVHIPWQFQVASILVPTALYGFLFVNETFPVTERVSSGISTEAMVKACTRPLFIIMVFCMLLTAATELGTNQWITALLSNVGVPSILLLVFINGLMAIGRSLAGEVVHKLSPLGMLLFSALFSAIGLSLLAHTSGGLSFVAAAIFAVGICFFWPTMLGFVSEYLPKTGALGLSIMGGAGMLSVSFILPYIGYLYEANTIAQLPAGTQLKALQAAAAGTQEFVLLKSAQLVAGAQTLQWVAILPCVLIVVFGVLFLNRKQIQS